VVKSYYPAPIINEPFQRVLRFGQHAVVVIIDGDIEIAQHGVGETVVAVCCDGGHIGLLIQKVRYCLIG
jgi:hypothetical protein